MGRHGRVSCSVWGPERTQIRSLNSDLGEDAAEAYLLSYSSLKFGSFIDRLRGASAFAKRYHSASAFNGIERRCLITVSGDGAF